MSKIAWTVGGRMGRPPKINSPEQVLEIRKMRDEGRSGEEIMERFGFSRATLYRHINLTESLTEDDLKNMFERPPEPKPVKPKPIKPPPEPEPFKGDEVVPCEWIAQSSWRSRQCSRSVPRSPVGLSLCWQHEDETFKHVVSMLLQGKFFETHIESLLNAVRVWEKNARRVDGEVRLTAVNDMARSEMKLMLEDMIEARRVDTEIADLVNQLVQVRLRESWGTE
jgi:hypothetical protein